MTVDSPSMVLMTRVSRHCEISFENLLRGNLMQNFRVNHHTTSIARCRECLPTLFRLLWKSPAQVKITDNLIRGVQLGLRVWVASFLISPKIWGEFSQSARGPATLRCIVCLGEPSVSSARKNGKHCNYLGYVSVMTLM